MSSRIHSNIENRQQGVRVRNVRFTTDASGFVTSCTGSLTVIQSGSAYSSSSLYYVHLRSSGTSETNDAYFSLVGFTSTMLVSGSPGNGLQTGRFYVQEENVRGDTLPATSQTPTGSIAVAFISGANATPQGFDALLRPGNFTAFLQATFINTKKF